MAMGISMRVIRVDHWSDEPLISALFRIVSDSDGMEIEKLSIYT